jgi:hypothetical protein
VALVGTRSWVNVQKHLAEKDERNGDSLHETE